MAPIDVWKTSREDSFRHFSSRLRRVCVLLFPLAALGIGAPAVRAQISPGPLSRAHQSLRGPTQCTSCHVVGKGAAELKCQECHREIASEIAAGRGLHSRFPDKTNCAACHSEHNGRDFPLIRWQPSEKAFDHRETGYPLEGKHAGLACDQCHTPAHIPDSTKPLIKMTDLRNTFLGLSQQCTTCHEDSHKGQLGENCTQCHNFLNWKGTSNFDHSKTKFPLTGLHAQVPCEKCHASATPGGPARLTGIAFAKCSDCHEDPHHDTFPQSCETCHTTSGWKKVAANQKFDHSKTKFPLLGKHAGVDCVQCHANADFKKPVAFAKCVDCHRDAHGGQFAERDDAGECSSCHTVNGWKPSLFDVKAHGASAYPLLGKHASVECAKCHVPAGRDTRYKIAFSKCTDCHADAHGGQFAAAPYHNRCEACHTVHGFQPSTFTIAEHQKTRFPLKGSHMAVPCFECHTGGPVMRVAGRDTQIVPYHFAHLACTTCHQDPHGGKFQQQMAKVNGTGRPSGCQACHSVDSWTDLPGFDHSKTHFPLRGAHAKVACEECHKPLAPQGKLTEASFQSAPTECAGCHQDPHAGQFVKEGKVEACGTCHTTEHWKPSTFDHETQTDFSLKGAHEKVACALCHTAARIINGKRVVFYQHTPRECSACHN
jgi:Cytochrome c7 and related cytochrome c